MFETKDENINKLLREKAPFYQIYHKLLKHLYKIMKSHKKSESEYQFKVQSKEIYILRYFD